MGFVNKNLTNHLDFGFSLLELVVFIVVTSILIVTMFAAFTRISQKQEVNINTVVEITQNAAQYFENWIITIKNKCPTISCPSSVTNFLTNGYTITCNNTSTNVLCSTKLNDDLTYSITATITPPGGSIIDVASTNPHLANLPVWKFTVTTNVLKGSIIFFSYTTTKMVPK